MPKESRSKRMPVSKASLKEAVKEAIQAAMPGDEDLEESDIVILMEDLQDVVRLKNDVLAFTASGVKGISADGPVAANNAERPDSIMVRVPLRLKPSEIKPRLIARAIGILREKFATEAKKHRKSFKQATKAKGKLHKVA
jgi:hypothetical protein